MRGGPKPTGHLNTEHSFCGGDGKATGEVETSGLRKVRERKRDVLYEGRKLRECLNKAKRDLERLEEDRKKNKEVRLKVEGGRERAGERERVTSFQKHNEDTAAVQIPEAFSPLCARSSSAHPMSWQRTSAPHLPQVAPSAPAGHPGSWCSLPWSVTDLPCLKHRE